MKKNLVIVASLLVLFFPARAQEAFNSLSFGLEAGTTGVGVELALPLVSDHLAFAVGFNAPSLSYPFTRTLPMDAVNGTLSSINSQLESIGAADRVTSTLPDVELTIRPVLNLSTFKLMLEYYPFRKSSFHITAGAYFGMGENLVSASVSVDSDFWAAFTAVQEEVNAVNVKYGDVPGYVALTPGNIEFSAGDRTFALSGKDGTGNADILFKVSGLRPYAGIGFGRSVPKGHLGFQFDIGVWYHGIPVMHSDDEVQYDPDAFRLAGDISIIDRLVFYPQVSLRLIYRIF